MVYAIVTWRASRGGPEPVGGPAARGHLGDPGGLDRDHDGHRARSCSASGPTSSFSPRRRRRRGSEPHLDPDLARRSCPIQVIGQQWKFTYRYPTFGGFETDQLVVPDDTTIAFHVTSLDVIHSFWAYQLGVKADANPDYDNVAYTTTQQLGTFIVRCAELCGIWHGAMYNSGDVVTQAAVRGLGRARPRSGCGRTPSCCRPSPDLHPRRQRGRRRVLPRQRRPVLATSRVRRPAADERELT